MKGENSCKVSAEAKFIWIMPNRRRICGIAQQWRTVVQGECRSQIYLDYAEPPPNLRKCAAFAKGDKKRLNF